MDLKTKKKIKSIFIDKDKPKNRINDGKTDPKGNLWFGTMDNLERNIKNGDLYCLDRNFKLKKVDTNYIITNGPAFLNSKIFYHNDSRQKRIYKIKINKHMNIIKKNIFIKFNKTQGSPDGITTDEKNNLWVCHFNGARITVFNKKAKIIHKIKLPAKNITNCIFGGKNNSELFVTSAKKSMTKKEIKNFKLSGSLFKIKTNMKGKSIKKFNYI